MPIEEKSCQLTESALQNGVLVMHSSVCSTGSAVPNQFRNNHCWDTCLFRQETNKIDKKFSQCTWKLNNSFQGFRNPQNPKLFLDIANFSNMFYYSYSYCTHLKRYKINKNPKVKEEDIFEQFEIKVLLAQEVVYFPPEPH